MAITAAMVKELRERTGLGMMDCKNALQDTNGDIEQAIEELRKKSALKAAKKSGRTAADGLLGLKIGSDAARGVLVEVNVETDFATKNAKFIEFVGRITEHVYSSGEIDVAAEFEQERQRLVQEIGENISFRRATIVEAPSGGGVYSYLHGDQRKATLVALDVTDAELGRDIAMHITGSDPAPLVVSSDHVSKDLLDKEREIYAAQAMESGKPPEIVAKMVQGRIKKFLAEISLLDQPFVKDSDQTVGALLKSKQAHCQAFTRYVVGEGIDVEVTDFAAEVAAQIKGA